MRLDLCTALYSTCMYGHTSAGDEMRMPLVMHLTPKLIVVDLIAQVDSVGVSHW